MTTAQLIAAINQLRPLAVYNWPDGAASMADIEWRDERPAPTQEEIDAQLELDAAALAVPLEVSRRQARQALLLAGLLDNVAPAIAAIPDAMQRRMLQIEWEDSQVFQRHRPSLVALATALGLDDAALDQLFVTADAL
jgi:hypothetical protein